MHIETEALAECRSTCNPSTGGLEDHDFKASFGYIDTKPNQTKTEKGMAVPSHLENHFL